MVSGFSFTEIAYIIAAVHLFLRFGIQTSSWDIKTQ